jgi:transposase InsO family protein
MRQQNISVEQIAATVGKNRATIYRWLGSIKRAGITSFLRKKRVSKFRRPKNKTPEYIIQKIVDIRNEFGYCGFKIKKELEANHSMCISVATIYRILHERFTRHAVGVKHYHKHQPIVTAFSPREVIEHDTVDLGGKIKDKNGKYHAVGLYAYTSIDVFTKEPTVILATDLTDETGARIFKQQKTFYNQRKHHSDAAVLHQSDNGSEFGSQFVSAVENSGAKHRYSRPYKKNEQSHIENFNKALRSECFSGANYNPKDIKELQKLADDFVNFYINKRWHMGLPRCMTPKQFINCFGEDPERARMELAILHEKRNRRRIGRRGVPFIY